MKIVAFGDFHAHIFTEFAEVDEVTGNSRFTQQLKALEYMREYCVNNKIKHVLFAGDLFHKRRTVDQTVKNMVRDEIKRFGVDGIWMAQIPGNHDQVDNSDFPHHSLHSFKELDKVAVLDRFTPYELPTGPKGELVYIYPAPYSKNTQLVKEKISKYAEAAKEYPGATHILLAHLGVSGAFVGKGSYAMADAFAISDLHPDAFTFGVFGHFHKRQFLGGYKHFFYTGSPLQHSFNDEGEEKGFFVIDTVTKEVEFVQIPSPQFITVQVRDEADVERIQKELEGNFLRIQVEAEKAQEVASRLPDNAKFRLEPQKTFKEEKRVDVDFSMSLVQILSEYSAKFNPEAAELGLEILRETEETGSFGGNAGGSNITLEKLTIQNFMSIRKAEVPLSGQGLILVQGINNDDPAFDSNGAGKSTIFEGLCVALFDKTVRGISGDEIVNRNVGSNCVLTLDFKDESGNEYRINRYRKHKEHKNSCHIFLNGKNITPKSTKDANELIEKIVQMDFHTFTNSILFGQGLVKMFSVATDKEKKELLEKMLQMEQFQALLLTAKQKFRGAEDELTQLVAENEKDERVIQELTNTIEVLVQKEQEESARRKEKEKELKQKLKEAQKQLQGFKKKDRTEELKDLREKKAAIEEQLDSFKELEDRKNKLESKSASLETKIQMLEKDLKRKRKEMDEVASGDSKTCPECGQEIKTDEESIMQTLRHLATKVKEIRDELNGLLLEFEEVQKSLEDVELELQRKDDLVRQNQQVVEEILELQAEIRADEAVLKQLKERIADLEEQLEDNSQSQSYQELIEEKKNERKLLLRVTKERSKKQETLQKELPKLKFWVEAFGNAGIKSYLLDSVTPFLNQKANEYISKLAGSTMQIEFSTQTRLASGELRDKFEVRLLNSVGGDSYVSNSTGERRRIDLAISLALQKLVMSRSNMRLNTLLYDEIFDGLDAVGCENAIQLLQDMQKETDSIFVITHNDILKSYFDKFLVVKKENGETKVYRE